ncbi:MAG TPA: hypothetical protein DEP72_04630 [Clostridiales bacterium]|nr:MAG: hypothetical protein A2Y18_05425 [Clostridiales bacterium GWD2_32_19]HCC07428.1 hypothetical protein [Clostridiales bacterium]
MKPQYLDQVIKTLLITFLFIAVLTPLALTDEHYNIKSYDVTITVSKNNVYFVTEKILVYFGEEAIGITKRIPINHYNYEHKVSDINVVNEKNNFYNYIVEKDGDFLDINIGSANDLVRGHNSYIISYTYDMGEDIYGYMDEMYWNILNNTWDATVYNCSFRIELPSSFDYSKIKLYLNDFKNHDDSGIIWDVRDNVISGNTIRPLDPHEQIIIDIPLQEKYFTNPTLKSKSNFTQILITTICLLFAISFMSFVEFKINRRRITPKTASTPPLHLNCAEIKYFYNHVLNVNDINSLIIQWANKGFVKIDRKLSKYLRWITYNDFFVTKLRDIVTEDGYEKTLFDEIFSLGETVSLHKHRFKIKKLSYKARNSIIDKIDKLYKPFNRFYYIRVKVLKYISALVLILVVSNFFYFVTYSIYFSVFLGALFSLVIHWIYINLLENQNNQQKTKSAKYLISYILKFGSTLVLLLITVISIVLNLASSLPLSLMISTDMNIQIFIVYLIIYILIIKFTVNTFKVNIDAIDNINEVIGFANFIEQTDYENLVAILKENPNLFIDLLPYSILFKNHDYWISKFSTDSTFVKPEWYTSDSSTLDTNKFASHLAEIIQE